MGMHVKTEKVFNCYEVVEIFLFFNCIVFHWNIFEVMSDDSGSDKWPLNSAWWWAKLFNCKWCIEPAYMYDGKKSTWVMDRYQLFCMSIPLEEPYDILYHLFFDFFLTLII